MVRTKGRGRESLKDKCLRVRGYAKIGKTHPRYYGFYAEGNAVKRGLKCNKVDMKQLGKGIRVEVEHTKDRDKATKIALDHLSENPKYYDWLECMERAMDAKTDKARMKVICESGMGGKYQDNVYEWDGRKAVCKRAIEKRRK